MPDPAPPPGSMDAGPPTPPPGPEDEEFPLPEPLRPPLPRGGDWSTEADICRLIGRVSGLLVVFLTCVLAIVSDPALTINLDHPKEIAVIVILFIYLEALIVSWVWEFPACIAAVATVAFAFVAGKETILHALDAIEVGTKWIFLFIVAAFPVAPLALSIILRPKGERESEASRGSADSPAWMKIAVLAATLAVPAVFGASIRFYRNPWIGNAAVTNLRALVTAEEQFKSATPYVVYGTLSQLSGSTPPLIDSALGKGKKSGYSFTHTVGTPADSNWHAQANPIPSLTRQKFRFFVDSSGVIRFHVKRPATSADSPIE